MDNFRYDLDLSENIPEQLKKRARTEKRSKHGREGSHCRSSDYSAPIPSLLEIRYLDHLRLLDQFLHRKRNQYYSCSTIETPNIKYHKKISLKCHIDFTDR